MRTTSAAVTKPSRGGAARHRALQAMLNDRQHDMQDMLRRRLVRVPEDGPDDGLDESEHAEADIQEHITVALIQLKGETLERLREALARLEEGEYGYCADCGEDISEKRLQALPFALRCTVCESTHEQSAARDQRVGSRLGSPLAFAP